MFQDVVTDKCYLVCKACGWVEGPYDKYTAFAGVAGQLACPKCSRHKLNKNIEVYGNVDVMRFIPNEDLTLNQLIKECGEAANKKGWTIKWDGTAKESFPIFMTLTAHEILDAVDKGWRDNNKKKAFEELGDGFVREFHICHDLNIPMQDILKRIMKENEDRPYRHGRVKL